jgi:hypothetical protein
MSILRLLCISCGLWASVSSATKSSHLAFIPSTAKTSLNSHNMPRPHCASSPPFLASPPKGGAWLLTQQYHPRVSTTTKLFLEHQEDNDDDDDEDDKDLEDPAEIEGRRKKLRRKVKKLAKKNDVYSYCSHAQSHCLRPARCYHGCCGYGSGRSTVTTSWIQRYLQLHYDHVIFVSKFFFFNNN